MARLERTVAGVSIRLWALIANLMANIVMVYGAVHYFTRGTHAVETIAGVAVTLACVAILAIPDR